MEDKNWVRLSFVRTSGGSGMTRVENLKLGPREKEWLLSELKKRFGCGGTVKEGALELQGDRREELEEELRAKGLKVKRLGG